METATFSTKCQLVIPRRVRERLDESLAIEAADLSLAHGLTMADAVVYATTLRHGATLVTGDADFEGFPNAVLIR